VKVPGRAAGYNTLFRPQASGATLLDTKAEVAAAALNSMLSNDPQPDDADENQINRNDVVEEPRHDQNQNACDQSNDRLNMGDTEGHGMFPRVTDCDALAGSGAIRANRRGTLPP
jgi:hypothetical protein